MKKNMEETLKTLTLTLLIMGIYSLSNLFNIIGFFSNTVHASSLFNTPELKNRAYNNSNTFIQPEYNNSEFADANQPLTKKIVSSVSTDTSFASTTTDNTNSVSNNSLTPTNIIQVNGYALVHKGPSSTTSIIERINNVSVTVLNKEDKWYFIEYTTSNIKKRGYIDEANLSNNSQIPLVDYSRCKKIIWSHDNVDIYCGPSLNYEKIGLLRNQTITMLSKEDDWYFIEYGDSTNGINRGYVKANDVTIGSFPYAPSAPIDSSSLNQNIKKFLDIARGEIGTIGSGENGNNTKYGAWYGTDGMPWCSTFIDWVASNSGLQDIFPKTESYSDSINWFKSKGQWGNDPKIGSLLYLEKDGLQHIGIVESINDDGTITAIEGNFLYCNIGQVARVKYTIKCSLISGYAYPKYPEPTNGNLHLNESVSIYSGPTDEYTKLESIKNECLTVLNKEGNRYFVEYTTDGIKKRGYIEPSNISVNSTISLVDYSKDIKPGVANGRISIKYGPSDTYTTINWIENQQVQILTIEDNWYFIEYTTPNGKERGYVESDCIKLPSPPVTNIENKVDPSSNTSGGTTDVGKYLHKFTDAVITSYSDKGPGAAGGNYYCDGNGKIAAAHNLKAGTVIYIPDLKYVNSTGIFTVGDTGGPFFDFDINTSKNIDRSNHDVYVLSWGDGSMMESFDAAKQEQMNYGNWNRNKSLYEQYKGQFQTENFTQP